MMSQLMQDTAGSMLEKNGIIGLLYLVLAGIGVFIARVGWKMVDAIRDNTTAVKELAYSLGTLIRQHEAQAMAAKEQIAASTQAVLEAVKEGIRNVRDDIKENGD